MPSHEYNPWTRNGHWQFGSIINATSSAPATDAPQTTAFLARTTGLDATHTSAYKALINGLVADGVFSNLDVLYIFATQDSATALLNLVSSSFNGIANGAPTFTIDRGFTGVAASTTVYVNSGFNPTTAPSPKYTQNSAHVSIWSATDLTVAGTGVGASSATYETSIYPRFTDGNAYYRINDPDGSGGGIVVATAIGHYLANRSGSNVQQGYKNAVDQGVVNRVSGAPVSGNIYVLAYNNISAVTAGNGTSNQIASCSIGGNLSSTQVTAFYNRLRTYMTTVGVP